MSFVSEPLLPGGGFVDASALTAGAPAIPSSFTWRGEILEVAALVRTWRSTKTDRGDTYLKRHWYEATLRDGRTAVIYFERGAKRGAARWWLYSLAGAATDPST